jgi:hypothetical protein
MSRMNSRQRRRLYKPIVERDGEKCNLCDAKPPEAELVIDHKDNDNSNNDLENLQLLCRRCNYIKNPRTPIDDKCVSVSMRKKKKEDLASRTEIEINRTAEPCFREYLLETLRSSPGGEAVERELVNSGAFVCNISPVTTQRYLNKLCSEAGPYTRVRVDKTIFIRRR